LGGKFLFEKRKKPRREKKLRRGKKKALPHKGAAALAREEREKSQ